MYGPIRLTHSYRSSIPVYSICSTQSLPHDLQLYMLYYLGALQCILLYCIKIPTLHCSTVGYSKDGAMERSVVRYSKLGYKCSGCMVIDDAFVTHYWISMPWTSHDNKDDETCGFFPFDNSAPFHNVKMVSPWLL